MSSSSTYSQSTYHGQQQTGSMYTPYQDQHQSSFAPSSFTQTAIHRNSSGYASGPQQVPYGSMAWSQNPQSNSLGQATMQQPRMPHSGAASQPSQHLPHGPYAGHFSGTHFMSSLRWCAVVTLPCQPRLLQTISRTIVCINHLQRPQTRPRHMWPRL